MGRMTFALCYRLGPWCHAIYPVLHLKGAKEKQGKVPHLPPTEPQKRLHEKHHLQMYPPEKKKGVGGIFMPPKNTPSQIRALFKKRRRCRGSEIHAALSAARYTQRCKWLPNHYLKASGADVNKTSRQLIQISPITSGVLFRIDLWPFKLNMVRQRLWAKRQEKPSHCSRVKGPLQSEERRWQLVGSSLYTR